MMRFRRGLWSLTVLAFSLSLVTPVIAAPAKQAADTAEKAPSKKRPAKKKKKKKGAKETCAADDGPCHLDAGTKLFKDGKLPEARAELEKAFELTKSPKALRLIGECQRLDQHFPEAYETYERLNTEFGDVLTPKEKQDVELMLNVLDLLTGQLEMHVDEAGATVLVDDKEVGTSPFKKPVRVGVGPHKVKVTLGSAAAPLETEADVKAQQKLAVYARFNPGNKKPIEVRDTKVTGFSVKVKPSSATIKIDGQEVGTGSYDGELAVGSHKLEIAAEGHKPLSEEVTLEEGHPASRDLVLETESETSKKEEEAPPTPPKPSSSGLYGGFNLFGSYMLVGQQKIPCPAAADGKCTQTASLGGGAVLRGGYAFGSVFGVEATALFLGERATAVHNISGTTDPTDPAYAEGDAIRRETFLIYSLGGFAGAGPRLNFGGESFKVTFGASPGVAFRRYSLERKSRGEFFDDTFRGASQSLSFGVAGDLGVTLGKTPGFRFYAGVFAFADFERTVTIKGGDRTVPADLGDGTTIDVTLPTPDYRVARGLQLFIGPMLGIQFGH